MIIKGERRTSMNQNQMGNVSFYPYNNNLITNTPYDNYMNRVPQQQNQFLKCRPVSSMQEAMAFQIDLDGSLWVFPNVANGKIYTKQINNDGTACFNTYTLTKNQTPYSTGNYVTKEEFNSVIQGIMAAIHPQNVNSSPTQEKPMTF